jgi:hypothetical protein
MTNLDQVPPDRGFLHGVPLAWRVGASFPVPAYLMTSDEG